MYIRSTVPLTLIFSGVRFEVAGGGGGGMGELPSPTPCLKLVRIMLETSYLACTYTHICSFRKYTFQYQGSLNFANVRIFFEKSGFFYQSRTFTQINSVTRVFDKVTFCHFSCSQHMLSSTYLLFENIKFCITEINYRMTSPWG